MAILLQPINREQVKRLAGLIDFYYYKGIPVARKWPTYVNFKPRGRTIESNAAFKASRANLAYLDSDLVHALRLTYSGKRRAWLDAYTRRFMNTWKLKKAIPDFIQHMHAHFSETNLEVIFQTHNATPVQAKIFSSGKIAKKETKKCQGKWETCPDEPDLPPDIIIEQIPDITIISLDNITAQWAQGQYKSCFGSLPSLSQFYLLWNGCKNYPYWTGSYYYPAHLLAYYSDNFMPPPPYRGQVFWHVSYLRVSFSEWYAVHTFDPSHITFRFFNDYPYPRGSCFCGSQTENELDCSSYSLSITIPVIDDWLIDGTVDIPFWPNINNQFTPSVKNPYFGLYLSLQNGEKGACSISKVQESTFKKFLIPLDYVQQKGLNNIYLNPVFLDGSRVPPACVKISTLLVK